MKIIDRRLLLVLIHWVGQGTGWFIWPSNPIMKNHVDRPLQCSTVDLIIQSFRASSAAPAIPMIDRIREACRMAPFGLAARSPYSRVVRARTAPGLMPNRQVGRLRASGQRKRSASDRREPLPMFPFFGRPWNFFVHAA
jgi:hypothetical protein